MKERKTSRGQIVMLIILSILLVLNSAYIIYDKYYLAKEKEKKAEEKIKEDKEDKKEKVDKEKTTRNLSLAEEKILLSQIDDYNTFLAQYYPIQDIKELDNQKKLLFAYALLDLKGHKDFMQGELKKIVDSYFGKDNNVIYEDIICDHNDGVLFKYDSTTRVFEQTGNHGHDHIESYRSNNYLITGNVLNEEEYTVEVKTIYENYCGGTCGPTLNYYKNAKDAKREENPVITRQEEKELTETDYEKVKNKLESTIYTFKKDSNGNYGLKSVKNKI